MAVTLLLLFLGAFSFLTGALKFQVVANSACRLSAYDAEGQRRFALTVSTTERPDIAVFNARGERWQP